MEQQVIVVKTTRLLIPNSEHKNFTETKSIVPEGSTMYGTPCIVEGLRKGEPFKYRLFKIKDIENYIYQSAIKPIKNMEDNSNAEGPNTLIPKKLNAKVVIGAVAGFGLGYYIAHHKGVEGKSKWVYATIGGIAGYIITQQLTKPKVVVK